MFFKIPGLPLYEISKEGKVKSLKTGRILVPYKVGDSDTVCVYLPGGGRGTRAVNRLLKLTFPEDYYTPALDTIYHEAGETSDIITNEDSWSPVQKQLRSEYLYSPETGEFKRIKDDYVGYKEVQGYLCTRFRWKDRKIHRLIMLYMLGSIPEDAQVDHVDHNLANNKWDNLRLVSKHTNGRNLPKYSTNTSGTTGVSWHKKQQKWVARVMVNNKAIQIGSFSDKEEAIQARKDAIEKFNFHENHGN